METVTELKAINDQCGSFLNISKKDIDRLESSVLMHFKNCAPVYGKLKLFLLHPDLCKDEPYWKELYHYVPFYAILLIVSTLQKHDDLTIRHLRNSIVHNVPFSFQKSDLPVPPTPPAPIQFHDQFRFLDQFTRARNATRIIQIPDRNATIWAMIVLILLFVFIALKLSLS